MKPYTTESYKGSVGGMQNTWRSVTTWHQLCELDSVRSVTYHTKLTLKTVSQIGPRGQEVHLEKSSNK